MYDYYLGGKDNFAADREMVEKAQGSWPTIRVHEVAQGTAPSCRVVYADNDPLVLTHARALLTSGPEGRTAYIHADLRDPAGIVAHPVTRDVLDFTQPIALMLVGILPSGRRGSHFRRVIPASSPGWRSPAWN